MDHNPLSLVQQDVKTTEEWLARQRVDLTAMQNTVTCIQNEQSATRVQLEEHDEQLAAVLEWKEQQKKENEEILAKLVSEKIEEMLSEEVLIRLAKTDSRVEQLEQGFARMEMDASETGNIVKQLVEAVRSQGRKENKSGLFTLYLQFTVALSES